MERNKREKTKRGAREREQSALFEQWHHLGGDGRFLGRQRRKGRALQTLAEQSRRAVRDFNHCVRLLCSPSN